MNLTSCVRALGLLAVALFTSTAGSISCARGLPEDTQLGDETGGDTFGFNANFDGAPDGSGPCVGLECQRVVCGGGVTTTITGKVYAPTLSGPDPLYNAIVYIPNAPLKPFATGVSCDKCGALVSGSPIATALSGPDGTFVLKNVPVGDNIPIVVQLGRWRRKFELPKVDPCVDNPVPTGAARLPRNQSEGDIPLHAVATGAVDGLECVLRKLGLDAAEFTAPSGTGRIHIYTENGAKSPTEQVAASALWGDLDTLEKYDIVLFPCEGKPNLKPVEATRRIIDYTSAGGRVLATHFSYVWIHDAPAPFPGTATWDLQQKDVQDPAQGSVNTSFPKGADFAQWLVNIGASTKLGEISIYETRADAVSAIPPSQSWITSTLPDTLQHYTFNTPVLAPAEKQCGRVVFSDFHVNNFKSSPASTFPAACADKPLSPQEKVIEFMLFDLASCVQKDQDKPLPPPLR